jgi:nitrite reductase (NO-forming)
MSDEPSVMRPRTTTTLYQTAARTWLTAAGASLLLPASWRLGLWLPLHLALAGAVSTAISGAMQNFTLALTATPAPAARLVRSQFLLVTTGATLIAVGMPTSTAWLTAVGGLAFLASMLVLGGFVWRAWRRSLNRRHVMPVAAYGTAIAFVLVGATLGALMGSQVVDGESYLHVRRAHMSVNVLGWASITVVGTLVTLLPTVLRLRMPRWPGRMVLGLLGGGLVLQLIGWDLASTTVLFAGGSAYAAGACGVVSLVVAVLRSERTWAIPAAGFHMVAAVAWFVAGSIGLALAMVDGPTGFDRYRVAFLTAFVGGWLLQVLLGAWSYLLPMSRPGHPTERRRSLAAFELLAPVQLTLLNGGLVLVAARGLTWIGPALCRVGVVAALAGGGIALAKAWFFPILGRWPLDTDRSRAVWGG